jgi:hypothetical protein
MILNEYLSEFSNMEEMAIHTLKGMTGTIPGRNVVKGRPQVSNMLL